MRKRKRDIVDALAMFLNHEKQPKKVSDIRIIVGGKVEIKRKEAHVGRRHRLDGDGSLSAFRVESWAVLWEGADGRREHLKYIPEDVLGAHSLGFHI